MRKATLRISGIVAAAAAALTLASVGPAFASTAAAKTMTGPEAITGSAHGAAAIKNVTPIPLTLAGVVPTTDHGFVLGNGNSNTHTLTTQAGKLTVTGTGKQMNTQTMNTEDLLLHLHLAADVQLRPGQEHRQVRGRQRSRRLPDLLRRLRAAVHLRQAQGRVQRQRQPGGQGRGRDLPGRGRAHRQRIRHRRPLGPGSPGNRRARPETVARFLSVFTTRLTFISVLTTLAPDLYWYAGAKPIGRRSGVAELIFYAGPPRAMRDCGGGRCPRGVTAVERCDPTRPNRWQMTTIAAREIQKYPA